MERRFRALRLVATVLKILAWIVLVVGCLLALFAIIVGAIEGRAGVQSPLLSAVPVLGQVSGLISGLIAGVLILLGVLIQFVLLYAGGEWIELALAMEENTRETAYYLKGESALPPPPVSWEEPAPPSEI